MFSNFGLLDMQSPLAGLLGDDSQSPGMPPVAPMTPASPQPVMPLLPSPQAAPIPAMAQPQAHPKQSLLGRVHDALLSSILGPTPGGYEGLLSQDEVQSQRPGLLRAMFDSQAPEEYQQSLDREVMRKQLLSQTQRAQQILQARQAVTQQFPPPTSGTEADMAKWAQQVYPALFAAGDMQSVEALKPLLEKYATPPAKGYEPQLFTNDKGETAWIVPGSPVPPGFKKASASSGDASANQDLYKLPKPDAQGHQYAYLKKGSEVPPGWVKQSEAQQLTIQGLIGDRFNRTEVDKGVKDFAAAIKPQRDRLAMIDQALTTISSAKNDPDPNNRRVLYKSALANFIQAADQKAQLRVQMVQYFDKLDPSIKGKWETLRDQLLKGERPQYQLQGMLNHLQRLRDLTRSEIDNQRLQRVKSRPELDDYLPSADTYSPTDVTTPVAPAAADLFKKFGITPVRKP
jgi:hypothetical protein